MAEASVQGRFLWETLVAADPGSAQSFYGKVVGWSASPWGADPTHTLLHAASGPVADVIALSPDMRAAGRRGHWLSYIGADDVDATVAHARSLGAKVGLPPTDAAEVGRFAVLEDPFGAHFGLFQPNRPSPPRGAPQHGQTVWHELMTTDPAAALGFYGDLFGWRLLDRLNMGPMGFYEIFGTGGVQYGGIFKPSSPLPGPASAWVAYFSVPDADAVAATVAKLGGQLCHGPADVPGGGRIAQFQDPSGVFFAVHSMKAPAAAAKPPRPRRPPAQRRPTPEPPAEEAAAPASSKPATTPQAKSSAKPAVKRTAPAKAAVNEPAVAAPPAARPKPKAKAKLKPKPKAKSARKPAARKAVRKAAKKAAPAAPARARVKTRSATARRKPAARPAARAEAGPARRDKAARKAEKARRKQEKKQRKKRDKDKKKKKDKKARRKK